MSSPAVATPAPRRKRRQWRRLTGDAIVYLLLILGVLAVILPFLYMLVSSLENQIQIGALTPQFWPHPWSGRTISRSGTTCPSPATS
jgi:multiple sugar transport system permease protein